MFFVLFTIFLIIYYLFLFITSSQRDKLSNLTTILSFVVGFLAIKYQINNDFMKNEEEKILKVMNKLNSIQYNGESVQQLTDLFISHYFNKQTIDNQYKQLEDILNLANEEIKNCLSTNQLIQENRNVLISKINYSKISILNNRFKEIIDNNLRYSVELSLLMRSFKDIKSELHDLNAKTNDNKTSFKLKKEYLTKLKESNKNLKESLKAKDDSNFLYNFLQK